MSSLDGCFTGRRNKSSWAGIDAAGVTGFLHADLGQLGQDRFEALPDPACEILAGWVFQALNFVEVMMIELIVKRLENFLQVRKIHDPAAVLTDVTADLNFDTK